jgi:hypothetical protein
MFAQQLQIHWLNLCASALSDYEHSNTVPTMRVYDELDFERIGRIGVSDAGRAFALSPSSRTEPPNRELDVPSSETRGGASSIPEQLNIATVCPSRFNTRKPTTREQSKTPIITAPVPARSSASLTVITSLVILLQSFRARTFGSTSCRLYVPWGNVAEFHCSIWPVHPLASG